MKLFAWLKVFRAGSEVAGAGAWKNAALVGNLLVAIVAVAALYGYKIELSLDNAEQIASGFIALVTFVNSVVIAITSKDAGLPAKKDETNKGDTP